MRKLILMRHAKAEAKATSGEDFDRALTERGYRDAQIMGRVLAEAGMTPDLALVSAAERTRQTWAGLAESFPAAEARFDRKLYNAGSDQIRDAVERAEGEADTVIVVGHNPGVPMAMLELIIEAAEPASVLEKARGSFPTASAVAFEFDDAMRPRFWNVWYAKDHGGGGGE
jgi:phosphohistidine phosphatase